ncbi:MAG: PD40 domain-containing protein, partial [Planctomycetes bacterium]|nr:PD40 domain-containing protein [Planctomycetota bacterium]
AAVAVALLLRSQAGHGDATSTGAKVVRATIMPPKGLTYKLGDRSIALSPDGSQVAMCLRPEQDVAVRHLYLRDIARLEFRQLAGTLGAIYPFWSPDGKSIGFFADGKLKRIDLSSGIVRVICDATLGRGASWGSKGTIVFAPSSIGGLWSVSDSGGTPTQITEPTSIDEGHRLPCVLPDGEKFLYFSFGGDVRGVFAFDPSTKSSKLVMASEAEGVYVEPGLLAFQRDNTLMVQPFDPQRLELSGTARPIAPGVHYNWIRQFINLGMNKDGTLVYHPLVPARRFRFEWVSKDGMSTPIGIAPQAMSPLFASLTLAPDGRRAVASVYSDQVRSSLVMLDLERGTQTPIGDPRWFGAIHAHWSESTKSILCLASMGARNGIWSIPLTGNDPPRELLSKSRFDPYPASVTADGKTLIYMLHNREQNVSDVMALSLEKDAQPTAILADPDKREGHPRLSPSGNVMAYIENLGLWGSGTLRVVSFPSISTPVTVSVTESSSSFGWLGENEIAWIDASRKGWSATITLKDGALDAGIPKPLFGGRPLEELAQIVAIDGPRERFLKVVEVERDPEPGLIYVSDWRQDAPDMPTATK